MHSTSMASRRGLVPELDVQRYLSYLIYIYIWLFITRVLLGELRIRFNPSCAEEKVEHVVVKLELKEFSEVKYL